MPGSLGFVDIFQHSHLYTTRTVVTSASSGVTVSSTLPADNIFNKQIGKVCQFTGVDNGDAVRLDIRIVRTQVGPLNHPFGAGVLGLLNVSLLDSSGNYLTGSTQGYSVNVTCNSGAFSDTGTAEGGGTMFQSVSSPRNMYLMLSNMTDETERLIGGRRDTGASPFYTYLRILIDDFPSSLSGGFLNIGRIVLMPLFGHNIDAESFSVSTVDQSNIVQAYDGTPYALRVRPYRTVSFGINELYDDNISAGPYYHATAQNVSYYAGTSESVILVPDYFGAAQFFSASDQPVYGILEKPLDIHLLRPGTSDTRLYRATGQIREIAI